jgi:phosphoglycerol transferase MdoB-like AlkP superfamily enzyme
MVVYGVEGWPGLKNVRSFPARALWSLLASYEDFLYVAMITLLFAALLWTAKNHGKLVTGAFRFVAAFSLAAALANRLILVGLGRPLNYQWLYYSDFLRSQEAKNAILADLSAKQLLIGVLVLAAMIIVARVLERVFERRAGRAFLITAALAASAYFSIGGVWLSRMGWDPFKLSNPVVFFARSILTARPKPKLMARTTSVDSSDFAPRPPEPGSSAIDARRRGIRNVVVFVMESVAERYVGAYGAPYGATPNLDAAATSRGALFTRISAHCPSTSSSLGSLLLSIYPSVSYKSLTRENTDLRFPSLSAELSGRNYRTAFWSSADSRFQGIELFLKNRGFGSVDDYRTLPCPGGVLHIGVNNPLLFGMDDACITDAFRPWIPETSGPPFFAMLWTMMTHYPYFASGKERDFGVKDQLFNRYLNGLHRGDEALGELLRTLDEKHLAESTLVVVVGDHGQAFGDHHQIGHGHNIYEENVHVPLILIAPTLFHGERIATVGGLIDVAPTILDILGIAPPAVWQGRSLFRRDRTGRVYMYGPYSGDLFGVREGDRKFIYSAAYDQSELYDLATDPLETRNRAGEAPDAVRLAQDRLVAWIQYQYPFLRALASGSVEGPARSRIQP